MTKPFVLKEDEKYVEYIKNTGGNPKIEWFDEDWEPIGSEIRKRLKRQNIIDEQEGKIILLVS